MPDPKNVHAAIHVLTFSVLAALTLFMTWVVLGAWYPKTTMLVALLIALFVGAPLGAFWMMYKCLRSEKSPLAYFVLAFVPYAFVWYYLVRVRPRKRSYGRSEHRSSSGVAGLIF